MEEHACIHRIGLYSAFLSDVFASCEDCVNFRDIAIGLHKRITWAQRRCNRCVLTFDHQRHPTAGQHIPLRAEIVSNAEPIPAAMTVKDVEAKHRGADFSIQRAT
jgi:hypothetical protein